MQPWCPYPDCNEGATRPLGAIAGDRHLTRRSSATNLSMLRSRRRRAHGQKRADLARLKRSNHHLGAKHQLPILLITTPKHKLPLTGIPPTCGRISRKDAFRQALRRWAIDLKGASASGLPASRFARPGFEKSQTDLQNLSPEIHLSHHQGVQPILESWCLNNSLSFKYLRSAVLSLWIEIHRPKSDRSNGKAMPPVW